MDSLKCNSAQEDILNYERAESLYNRGMMIATGEKRWWPGHRSYFCRQSHIYWPTDNTSLPSWWDGYWRTTDWSFCIYDTTFAGPDTVIDIDTTCYYYNIIGRDLVLAGGDTVRMADTALGDTAGWLLFGPWAYLEFSASVARTNLYRMRVENVHDDSAVVTCYVVEGYDFENPMEEVTF